MSRFLTLTSAALMLTACGSDPTLSANPPAEGPAIWTLADADTTVHLFGYTQVLKPDVTWQSEAVSTAFNAADTLILETEPATPETQSDIQQTMRSLGFYQEGRTLGATLSDEQAEEIGTVSAQFGVPLTALDPLKPWLASMQLGVVAISAKGYDLTQTPVATLQRQATERGMTIRSLESPTTLMQKIAGLNEDEQIGMLLHGARTLRDDPEQTARVNSAWLAGDVNSIAETLHGDGGDDSGAWPSDAVYTLMLTERNEFWRDDIATLMETETGTYFIAVGLGHLAGKDSLVSMLDEAGYTVLRQSRQDP
ncbi:TraB/GumN family protein [Algimonas porphyrae]|uniref:TraB/GumN family protein n=1 Tax=Algimonas porphyrae TaxID=1128113 RepID=A0ABQ5V1X1_9PROT|nr:TraB/GumN family protein [Algimonas porphyrae]GLQ20586.1 TraB/GumN family protein [Algimonas porphyrae]